MLVASTVALVLAQALVILLHETSHSVAGLLLGHQATQFTGEVRFNPEPTAGAAAAVAFTGPAFSLLSGLALVVLVPLRRGSWWRLLLVWTAFLSVEEGVGYLVIAPLVAAGDTGAGLQDLNAPGWVAWAMLVVGAVGVVVLARPFAEAAVRWTRDLYEIRAMVVWTWLVGSLVGLGLALVYATLTAGTEAGAVVAIVFGSVSLAIFSPMAMLFWQGARTRRPAGDAPTGPAPSVPVAAWVLLVALVVLNLLVLTRGLHLG
ncbi:MAG: hypothetical protein M3Y71_13250 [Actinomycetota bacterium]|nr:hypothetical protein [Actinomycetota bacterium]